MAEQTITRATVETVRMGYIQEANRLFFHPLGLMLAVNNPESPLAIAELALLDFRDTPGGCAFNPDVLPDYERKARFIYGETQKRMDQRLEVRGYWHQPAGVED